jgi:hypothetical protein
MAQGLFRDVGKKNQKGNKILGKPFTMHHCYEVLGNEEKWKTRGKLDVTTMAANATSCEATIIDDDDSSEEGKKRSSTPHSVNNARKSVLGRKAARKLGERGYGCHGGSKSRFGGEASLQRREEVGFGGEEASQ